MIRLPSGTSVGGPLKTNTQSAASRQEITSQVWRSNYRLWYEHFGEFDGATLTSPATTRISGTTPTMAKVANEVDGVWRATLAATSEAEVAGVDFGDSLMLNKPDAGAANVNAIVKPVFEAYVRIPTALTTAQTAVIGIGTAFNATLASISKYAWFRIGPASMNVTVESNDGTTTNLLVAAGQAVTLTANKFYLFTIDWTFLDQVRFSVDDGLIATLNMLALAATDKFQPLIYLAKASGTTTPTLDVDWWNAASWRVGI
jgi:hypothetical protein